MAAVEIAGIKKLKIYNTGNIKMWKHPNYYKNLRKLARLRNRDQAISDSAATADRERAPRTGQSGKQQAASDERQATSEGKRQATSGKRQASE